MGSLIILGVEGKPLHFFGDVVLQLRVSVNGVENDEEWWFDDEDEAYLTYEAIQRGEWVEYNNQEWEVEHG